MHRHDAQLPPERPPRRLALEGPPAGRAAAAGAMRWDIRHPEQPFGDRFVLVAGHTVPLVYATLAVCNEALRARYERDRRRALPAFPDDGRMGADLGGPARSFAATAGCRATPRWRARRSSSSSTPARRVTARRPPRARRSRSSAPARTASRSSLRGRGRPHPRRRPRDEELGLGPRPRQPRLLRLERLRHRRATRVSASSTARRATGSSPTAGASSAPSRAGLGAGHARAARGRARRQSAQACPACVVQDAQGPRLRQVRLQVARHAARA